MSPKRKNTKSDNNLPQVHGVINGAGEVVEQRITNTIEENYMPYAMSVIMSRAIPEIDGFKPSHRKLLYTMYKMGLLNSQRTKSANIVGQTMKLNPHGDSAIYETMVRLSRGYEALLHPYIDSKGNFGKFYSRDMAWAASRYTEARLDPICNELFRDIEKDTVDFVDNYDNTLKEPTLLPATYPSVLVNANTGIAVGMASSICPFNLKEICATTIELIKNPDHEISTTLLAPDFPGGGQIIYDKKSIEEVYKTGKGSIKIRARYQYDSQANCIDITSIPPTTTSESIIEKVIDLVKAGKLKEISDIRDETGIDGLKITIDLKRSADPDKLMQKLYKNTSLQDSFSCNFNILVSGVPRVMGVYEILNEWISFRVDCIKRRTKFDMSKKSEKLHLLKGLSKILLNIDKAISIIRNTQEESDVIPNLMIGFGIDEIQAEYVCEIKLRHLNKEYIIKRTSEIEELQKQIDDLKNLLSDEKKIKSVIVSELTDVSKKYGKPRVSMIIYNDNLDFNKIDDEVPNYPVCIFLTKDGYFKKITPQSLRMNSDQKLKDSDKIIIKQDTTNDADILFFTDKYQVYKAKVSDFQDMKASVLGEYIKARLLMDEKETVIYMASVKEYVGYMLFFFENGKVAKVDMKSYETKTNRRKLVSAYSDKSPLVKAFYIDNDCEYVITSSQGKMLILHTGAIQSKTTKSTQGVFVMNLKKGHRVINVEKFTDGMLNNSNRYRTKSLPASGALKKDEDMLDQLEF